MHVEYRVVSLAYHLQESTLKHHPQNHGTYLNSYSRRKVENCFKYKANCQIYAYALKMNKLMWWIDADDCFVGEFLLRGHQEINQLKSCYGSNSTTTRKEKFHSISNYMHRRRTVVWTQRNRTHSEVANKPQYPMITAATLNESINMKIVTTRKDYSEH